MFRVIILGISLILSACIQTHTNISAPSPRDEKSSSNKQISANYNLQLGMGYLSKGNTERAKEKLLRAEKQAPDWPPLMEAMGYFYERTGDLVAAKKIL